MDPKKYISGLGLTIEEAADEMGYSRPHLTDVLNGKTPASRNLAEIMEGWSDGAVTVAEVLSLFMRPARTRKSKSDNKRRIPKPLRKSNLKKA